MNTNSHQPEAQRKSSGSKGCFLLIACFALIAVLVAAFLKFSSNRKDRVKGEMIAVAENPQEQKKVAEGIVKDMIRVSGGTFKMGLREEKEVEQSGSAVPQHSVTLSDYYISRFEVTQREWAAVMGSIPSENASPDHPIENITWDDCQEFIRKLNEITGKKFRLPTEAEWEYAARGGRKSNGFTYSGSNNLSVVGWYDANSPHRIHRQDVVNDYKEIRNIGTKEPNELGLYDMSGNAEEWCSDYYAPYPAAAVDNQQGPATGEFRVIRGGNFYEGRSYCEVTRRRLAKASFKSNACGLRLAATEM